MGEREAYEVLRLIEHNQKCYISSDYVEGKSLIQWLKYHPNLTKKQLFLWIRDLADQLECIHKCRGNPCYQYVNPYSVIVTEDMTLHFLDMSVESNEKMLVQMNRRSVRENFLPPEVNYYQAASIELDIYGLGRTIQYLLSVTDPIPELTRRETVKFQKIISRCLDGHSKRAFKQMSEIQKEIPNVTEKKSKDRRIWTKKRTVMAMISICVFVAAVSVRVIQKKGDEKNTELKMESSDGLNMSEVSEREAFVEAQRSMGLLYFLELEDYEKSIQAFEDAGEDQMAENLAALVRYVVAGVYSGKNPIEVVKHYGPAYITAVGTMSSAATLAVALRCARKSKVLREDMVDFGVPLFANIHLCGSVLTEVFFCMIVSKVLYGTLPDIQTLVLFCVLLAIFAIGAPGVPGGTVMASLGLITGVLGFGDDGTALMLAIFALQDSFGTACNVTGDGALTLFLTGYAEKHGIEKQSISVEL